MKTKRFLAPLPIFFGLAFIITACSVSNQAIWSADQVTTLKSLWIGSLPPVPPDPSNKYADNPDAAVFGQKLFFDTRFSANGEVACATCHQPDKLFQDSLPRSQGVGTTPRRAMTVIGTAYSPWLFWDGRKDSLWAQALGPMENALEHNGNRTLYANLIADYYPDEYADLFGPLPDLSNLPRNAGPVENPVAAANWAQMSKKDQLKVTQIYVNMGKSIAAYERHLIPGTSRFDKYVEAIAQNDYQSANQVLNSDEVAGLKLFIGEAHCTNCHNGPLFTNNGFHNTGVPLAQGLPEDIGRAKGVQLVLRDEFNCLSVYSDAQPDQCTELNFLVTDNDKLLHQFKPPSLRNVTKRGPYMDAGQFSTLEEVLKHYNTAPEAPIGHSELEPLYLSLKQLEQLIAFLDTLNGPINAEAKWLVPPRGLTVLP